MRSILEELWYGNVCPNTGCRESTAEAKCRFEFPARGSTSSLVRQRAWESRSVAKLPCHSDQIWLWEAIHEAFFFVSSDANFEG